MNSGWEVEFERQMQAIMDGQASAADLLRLDGLLAENLAAMDAYVALIKVDALLRWRSGLGQKEWHRGLATTAIEPEEAAGESPRTLAPHLTCPAPKALSIPDSTIPSPSFSYLPLLGSTIHRTFGYLSSGWPVAYLVATVLFGIGLLIGSLVHVSQPEQVARQSAPLPSPLFPLPSVVGRITGMVDCKWEPSSELPSSKTQGPRPKTLVSLGDKFNLSSGLLEITYDTGAKVIVQGPVCYEAESNGGYLSLGKLTGKLEAETQDPRPKTPTPSSFIPPPSSFVIRTPTAIVTDLGTEFGVEVSKEGITETHVFLGKVRLQGRTQGGNGLERILLAGQTARLDQRAVVVEVAANSGDRFLRQMPAIETADSRELIDRIDYSDTWTANSPTRPGSNLPLLDPVSLQVEQCHGNPPRTWEVPTPTVMTTWPNDPRWPGFQVPGSRSGVMEVGGDCHCGFEYNLRDDFVVQFDAVQTADLINVTIGQSAHYTHDSPSLSVFVRAAGVPTVTPFFRVPGAPTPTPGVLAPEIGIYHPQKGEVNTGLRSGIAKPHGWHDYAVRFNLPAKRLTVWIDRECRGTIDLATLKDASGHPALAGLPWTGRYVSIGGFSPPDDKRRVWFDNFRVGSPREMETGIKQREATTSQTPEK